MKSDPKQHEIFRRFRLNDVKNTSCGPLPVPYHIYDGHGMFIGGTANLAAVRALLRAEDVQPVSTTDGKALMGVWVIEATDASLGAHQELQFSILVAHRPITDVSSNPFAILDLLLFSPDVRLLCHGLWNNTEKVIAYNREILALNARYAQGTITREVEQQQKRFAFTDSEGKAVFSGMVKESKRAPANTIQPMVRLMGLRKFIQTARMSILISQVVNPVGILPHNAEAQAYIANDRQTVRFFDPRSDVLTFNDETYCDLQFQGQFVEHMAGFKFVYLNIHNAGDTAYVPTVVPSEI